MVKEDRKSIQCPKCGAPPNSYDSFEVKRRDNVPWPTKTIILFKTKCSKCKRRFDIEDTTSSRVI